jgi:transcription elongation factor Elf1
MAFPSNGFAASITFLDAGNKRSVIQVGVAGADIAAAEAIVAANINDYVNVTDAYVESYAVREVFLNDAARTPAGEVEMKASITVNLTTPGKRGLISIPAPKATLFGAIGTENYDIVDSADALVIALIGDFESGGFSLSDGENVPAANAFVKGRRVHRSSSFG